MNTQFVYRIFIVVLAVWITAWVSSCKHYPYINPDAPSTVSNDCDADTVYFQNEILPLLVSNCAVSGCHDQATAKKGIILTNYASIIHTGDINLSNPQESEIYKVLNEGGDDRMPPPPASEFTAEQKAKVLKWIEQGALNNMCNENNDNCDSSNVTFNGSVKPVFEKHCTGCHSQPDPAYNIDLNNWDDLTRIVNDGSLIGSVKHEAGYYPMPKGYDMSDREVAVIVKWANDTTLSDPGSGTDPDPCDPDTVYFKNKILPLLVSNCATTGCHDEETHKEGVILTNYASVIETGEVKPGNPLDSKLYKVLFGGDKDDDIMPPPPANPFTDEQKQLIYDWIAQGALNNACEGGCDTTHVTFSGTIWPLMQTWCTGCHTGNNAGGGIPIENYADVVAIAQNGSLLGSINHDPDYVAMPKNADKLSDCQIAEIRIWIEEGTPDN